MKSYELYRYVVEWEEEDEVFVARVSELPSLAAYGKTHEKALSELKNVVSFILEELEEEGKQIPEPLASRKYNGKFQVRVSKELHRKLVTEALEYGTSLNQLVNTKISQPLRRVSSRN